MRILALALSVLCNPFACAFAQTTTSSGIQTASPSNLQTAGGFFDVCGREASQVSKENRAAVGNAPNVAEAFQEVLNATVADHALCLGYLNGLTEGWKEGHEHGVLATHFSTEVLRDYVGINTAIKSLPDEELRTVHKEMNKDVPCLSDDVTFGEVMDVVIKYIRDFSLKNPLWKYVPTSRMVAPALRGAFPCPVTLGTARASDQAQTFHGVKLGVSLGSQFKECPWSPPKKGDIPDFISPPDKDDKGNTIPCFHEVGLFTQGAYPQAAWSVQLFDHFQILKDAKGNYLQPAPLPGTPTIGIWVLVPALGLLRDGTIEGVSLDYLTLERDRLKNSLVEKFGAGHPPEKKMSPEMMKYWGLISEELWDTGWGELSLQIHDKEVFVIAKTSRLIGFERENKKFEF